MNTLPIIDIAPLYQNDPAARQAVAREIDAACRHWGFYYIKGHPIPASRIAALKAIAEDFFARPDEEKLRIDITQSAHHRGYGAIATEQLDPTRPSDLKETFDMGFQLDAEHPDVRGAKPLRGPITITEANAAMPQVAWTTKPPAKSSTPILANQPPLPQSQWQTGL